MPQVTFEDLPKVLVDVGRGVTVPVYLLHGDEFVYKSALKALLDSLVTPAQQDLNCESLDGDRADMHEIIGRLNTFPFLSGNKVVAVIDTNVFHSKVTVGDLLKKAQEAFDKENLKASARYFVRLLATAEVSLDEFRQGNWQQILDRAMGERSPISKEAYGAWLEKVIDYCLHEQVGVPSHEMGSDVLNEAILAGFPETNHLVLTAESVDRRCKLYKTIKKVGLVIDCSVPQGDSISDRRRQRQFLSAHMRQALQKAGKAMADDGFEALCQRTGGSLRSFSNELEKLIAFVGERTHILSDDVEKASEKTRQDPIYALTNAIGERNVRKSLSLIESLLQSGFFPLQILSVAINQTRRLLLIRDFIRTMPGGLWRRGMSYGAFQKAVLPELERRKENLIGRNAHPFVVYNAFVHSGNYSFEELAHALEVLLDADVRLKTTGQEARLVLARAIVNLCGKPDRASGDPAG